MTNAKAIETLRANYPDRCYELLREAVDMAIEALKAQDAAGDTISRQAAITEFSCCDLTPDGGIDVNDAIDFLKRMPSAQAERTGRWINVSDGKCKCSECGAMIDINEKYRNFFCYHCGSDNMRNASEIARDIMHDAIDRSVWSDSVNVEEMHKAVDDKYADMRKGE